LPKTSWSTRPRTDFGSAASFETPRISSGALQDEAKGKLPHPEERTARLEGEGAVNGKGGSGYPGRLFCWLKVLKKGGFAIGLFNNGSKNIIIFDL